ncbi:uncharacterized protein LOC111077895 [Drosophila obscura]|uniref:uncharacterized protein LOC111077895 n=1 Tax=Drosophila obscura TaxID=7282 RepID=UPI001BB24628|nr:uncharacterized protein LOC111077895 [Drosophila obscura]
MQMLSKTFVAQNCRHDSQQNSVLMDDNNGKSSSKHEGNHRSKDTHGKECDGCDLLCTSPKNIIFYAPYDRIQRRILTLTNLYPHPVLFKVKSNAGQTYHVSRATGLVEPYSSLEVNISLNHFDFRAECQYRHHFCVQSIVCPSTGVKKDSDSTSILAIFKKIPETELCIRRINVDLQTAPVAPPSRSLLDSAALTIRRASQRVIINQVVALAAHSQNEPANEFNETRANPTAECNDAITISNDSEVNDLNIRANIRISLNEFPETYQIILLGGAVVGVILIVIMNPDEIDTLLNMLMGFVSSRVLNTSAGSESNSYDTKTAPPTSCQNMPDGAPCHQE